MPKQFSLSEIINILEPDFTLRGNQQNIVISDVKPVGEASQDSLVWVNPLRKDKQDLVLRTNARLIITDDSLDFTDELKKTKCFIVVSNPKLAYIKVLTSLFEMKAAYGIHPTAQIHPEAQIHPQSYIGPFTYIGKSIIGENTIVDGHVFIYDCVRIGKNVRIQAGCVIGSDGLNITKDENNKWIQFPHVGGVSIEDDVTIDVLTHIDRGTLGDTLIGAGTKIDNCVYVAHNVKIGKNNVIIGHTMLSGSVTVGDNCWIGPSTTVRDGINIGSGCFVGMGSLVVKNIESGSRVMGSPAKPIMKSD